MSFKRSSGILFHPTSFPGPYGIGDLGPAASEFIDFLADSGSKLWQVLPLGPTGYGDSPYQCFSAFAGNPYLVSIDYLLQDGLLTQDDLADMPTWPEDKVDFGMVYHWKPALLNKAHARFAQMQPGRLHDEFDAFCKEQASWLDDYALFMAIKDDNGGSAWNKWPKPLRQRDPQALADAAAKLALQITQVKFAQFLFFRDWNRIKEYVHSKGIQIVGDIPIFVAMDSSDAWSHPDLFFLNKAGHPTVVAGVPPDYFSPTGQLWGNPLYRWSVHKKTGYAWWLERIRATLAMVDIVRIDHFRGFAGYWEIPGKAKTAIDGRWVPGPGASLFKAIRAALGDLPIIAEDLGEITPDVIALRDSFNLPGMKILQFAFSGPDNPFLPHHYTRNCVAYTGTHDNDTSWGWFRTAPEHEINFYLRYMASRAQDVPAEMIRAIWSSPAVFALATLQDFMGLETEARMNFPGKVGGYWSWRMPPGSLTPELKERIRELNYLYER